MTNCSWYEDDDEESPQLSQREKLLRGYDIDDDLREDGYVAVKNSNWREWRDGAAPTNIQQDEDCYIIKNNGR